MNVLWACRWDPLDVVGELPEAEITDIGLVDQKTGRQFMGDALMEEFKTGLELVEPDVVVFGLWGEQSGEQKNLLLEARIQNPAMKIIVASGERGNSDYFFDEHMHSSGMRIDNELEAPRKEFIVESLRQVIQGKETA